MFWLAPGEVSSISGSDSTSSSSSDEDVASVKPSPTPAHQKHHSHVYDGADASDSDSEDVAAVMAAARRHPKVFLKNQSGQLLSLYRCVLYHKKVRTKVNTAARDLLVSKSTSADFLSAVGVRSIV